MVLVTMVSKTRSSGVTRLKSAREHCDKLKDPEERRKCLDDVLFDTVESIGSAVQEMDARNADRTNLMEQRLANIIEKGFNAVDARFNAVDARLNDIEKRVGLHDVDIAQIKSWVGTVFERVNAIEPKITMMGEKIDAMETTIARYFSKTGAGMHQ